MFKANYGEEIDKFEEISGQHIYHLRNQDDGIDQDHPSKPLRNYQKNKLIMVVWLLIVDFPNSGKVCKEEQQETI